MKTEPEKEIGETTPKTNQQTNKEANHSQEWVREDVRIVLLMRLKVLMLNHDLSGNVVEFLLGKTSKK